MALEKPTPPPFRWEDGLTEEGRRLLQQARFEKIPGADALVAEGYVVVAEVLSNSGRLVWNGPEDRVFGYRLAVVQEEIIRAREMDTRRREYRYTDGTVVPLKRFLEKPEEITRRRDLRSDRHGLTIWAKDISTGKLAAVEVVAQQPNLQLAHLAPVRVAVPSVFYS